MRIALMQPQANRAQFQIKTGGHSGTLIEVSFGRTMARRNGAHRHPRLEYL